MSVINNNNNISVLQFMSVFMWVDIATKQPSNLLNDQRCCLLTQTRPRSQSVHGEWKVIMFSVMASNYTMFAFTLITCFVNMIYLQII